MSSVVVHILVNVLIGFTDLSRCSSFAPKCQGEGIGCLLKFEGPLKIFSED